MKKTRRKRTKSSAWAKPAKQRRARAKRVRIRESR